VHGKMRLDFTASPALRIAQRVLSAVFIGMILLAIPFGKRMETDAVFGMVFCAVGIVVGSAMLYVLACLPFREAHWHQRGFRVLFRLATLGVIISPFHVPFWSLLTGQFPPDDFATWTIWVVMPVLLLSLLGPIVPIMSLMHHAELERKRGRGSPFLK
jgi:MFS family permease